MAARANAPRIMAFYPSHLIRRVKLADGTPITIRPIRREDGSLAQEFVRNLSEESRFYRFMDTLRELTPRMVSHFTEIDHHSHLALIAVTQRQEKETEIGAARCVATDERRAGEFAIVVADEWQRKGLGALLMRALIDAARAEGFTQIYGDIIASNARMLRFVTGLGFSLRQNTADPRVIRAELALDLPNRVK